MKWFSAGLTFVNVATIAGLILGILGGGLDEGFAGLALLLGIAATIWAWIGTSCFSPKKIIVPAPTVALPKSKRARRRLKIQEEPVAQSPRRPLNIWGWAIGVVFAMFAARSFCWVLWIDGSHWKIQSPYNLGDLSLHITYIKYFANGVTLWPDNPIYFSSKLRYPAGIDFFNSLLILQHFDLIRILVWTGLLGSAATFYGFYRWGGPFAVAGFLFNGGLAGFAFFSTHQFIDYQGERIAWKSIPLTMFVTQRGLLYAIPAGLLLLLHWRRKYFPAEGDESLAGRRGLIPWWVEWSIYATMPLFHVHTFLALSGVLVFWLVIGNWQMRKEIAILLAAAFVPATWTVFLITDHFKAKSILEWAPGWLQSDAGFSNSIPRFWIENFGIALPLVIALVGVIAWRIWKKRKSLPNDQQTDLTSETEDPKADSATWRAFAFVGPAAAIFLFAFFVKTAPWGWDNTKLIIWSYFICLPFLWSELISKWPIPVRAGVCFFFFFSGFVSLMGGLKSGGYDLADRLEVAEVAKAIKPLPIKERFAAFPTYNHPLLLNGRKVVLGYPGHIWTQGFPEYGAVENQLRGLMLGAPDWQERAHAFGARYLFWGNEEKRAYAASSQPWRGRTQVVAQGSWGAIYDLESAPSAAAQ
jgi:hypothetical protein